MTQEIIPLNNTKTFTTWGGADYLDKIRPDWQAKQLIQRVRRLLPIDPSSACQRLLNAAIHDLKEKIVIAGIDIAEESANQNKLPPIGKPEDIENYPTAKLIDLAYHMGLFSRAEWRRICRCYEIRRDLEHEDDEYEAGEEDCVYIFKTCIDVVLSVDPVQLLKVTDIKDLIEQPEPSIPDGSLISDYERAPQKRQEQIIMSLLSVVLDKKQSDIVQQNAFVCITYLQEKTHKNVKVKIGSYLQDKVGRQGLDERHARVANAAGVFPYLRQSATKTFYDAVHKKMENIGYYWDAYEKHGELLRSFKECGDLKNCPKEKRHKIVKWLALAYIGSPGGLTRFGNIRNVYYSNSAAPLIEDIISNSQTLIIDELEELRKAKDIQKAMKNQHVARRFEKLVDLAETSQ